MIHLENGCDFNVCDAIQESLLFRMKVIVNVSRHVCVCVIFGENPFENESENRNSFGSFGVWCVRFVC